MDNEKKTICDNLYKFIMDELLYCIDDELFTKTSFEELGKFYYEKALAQIYGTTDLLLQSVIRTIAHNNFIFENLTAPKTSGTKPIPEIKEIVKKITIFSQFFITFNIYV